MLNVIVALTVWPDKRANKKIEIKSDNLAVVEVLTSDKIKDDFLAMCARNVWLITSLFNIELLVTHIPGKNNNIAHCLDVLIQ